MRYIQFFLNLILGEENLYNGCSAFVKKYGLQYKNQIFNMASYKKYMKWDSAFFLILILRF